MSITDKIFFPCVIIWKSWDNVPLTASFRKSVLDWFPLLKKMTFPMETGVRRLKDTQQILVPFKPSRGSKGWFYRLVTVSWKQSGDSLLHRLLLGNWVPRPVKWLELIYFSQENLIKISRVKVCHPEKIITKLCISVLFLSSIGMPMNNHWMMCTNVYLTLVEVVHSDIF